MLKNYVLSKNERESLSFIWTVENTDSFNELLVSWNAKRPTKGHYVLLVRVLIEKWSPWLLYAVWGSDYQYSFHDQTSNVQTFQDQIDILNHTASAFEVKVEARGGANLKEFHSLYGCYALLNNEIISTTSSSISFHSLQIPGISQLSLNHPRAKSLCSPTSTTALIRYLKNSTLSPLDFAKNVYDSAFDIYGNWSFNIAQAYAELGENWTCYFERSTGMDTVWSFLKKELPLVVSIKGSLPGSILPYSQGHLILIKGFDADSQMVLCMDPAFPEEKETSIGYPLKDFVTAWERRNFLIYHISPINHSKSFSLPSPVLTKEECG